jgi:hypothetical protein
MFLLSMAPFIPAQSVPPPAPETPLRAPAELDQLLGPIALYPDPLIAEILPASTLPSEIVMAERYMNDGGDTNQIASQGWDPSVQALAHYPAVLKWMDDNLAWTTQLGQAFETQQGDVMDAIQRLRGEAQNLGNLPNTPQETVDNDNGDIEIEPANPDEMYVPDYPPDMIYYQPGVYCTYGIGLPIGLWLGYDWDWRSRRLLSWGPGHPRPGGWWHQSPRQRHDYISAHSAPAWHNGRGGAVAANRWDRGFAQPEVYRSFAQPVVPRTAAPRVTTGRPAENFHSSPALSVPAARGLAPVEHRAFAPSETTGGVFGGFQSGRDAQASSFRGQASRAAIAPSFSESRGGGGGGGGGGERKGR